MRNEGKPESESATERNAFAWPPSIEELDAMEMVFLGEDEETRIARQRQHEADIERRARAAELAARPARKVAPRTVTWVMWRVVPFVAAIAIGAVLGERQARLNRTPAVGGDRQVGIARAAERPLPPAAAPDVAPRASAPPAPAPASVGPHRDTPLARSPASAAAASNASTPAPTATLIQPALVPRPAPARALESASTPASAAPTPPVPAPAALASSDMRVAPLGGAASPDAVIDAVARPVSSAMAVPALPPAPAMLPAANVTAAVYNDQAAIKRTLQMYEDAYERLDARAAGAVWPTLDVPALSRAFEGLKAQALHFDRCDLSVGSGSATAICSGSTSIVRRIGNPDPLIEPLRWTFRLKRTNSDWAIESVSTKR